jgi:phosphopantetheine adenylyltransferase
MDGQAESHEHLNDVVVNQTEGAEDTGDLYDHNEYASDNYEEAPEEGSNQDQFASKFAALSRKEKALRERESEYESKFEEMERRLADYETRDQEPEVDWEDMLRNNPLKALEEAGLGYDKLTELALNDGKLTPDMQLAAMRQELENDYKQKFEELENRLDQKEQLEQDTYYDSIQQNFQDEIGNIVQQNPEKFELIAASEADGLVYDVIEEHYNETGRVLDIEEAADAVESYLEEEANKLMKLKKISNRLGIDPSELEAMEQVTLSNDHSAQVNYEGANRMLSDDESKARAARILQWE